MVPKKAEPRPESRGRKPMCPLPQQLRAPPTADQRRRWAPRHGLRRSFLTLELVVGATMLLQPQSKAGIFIGLPIPIPVPVFYGPAYYPPGYYYGPYG